ncbi:MAG: hypothetical protein WCK43_09745 [bacterium]
MMQKKIFCFVLFFLQISSVFGQSLQTGPSNYNYGAGLGYGGDSNRPGGRGYGWGPKPVEYEGGNYPGAIMIPINVWGATKTTGLFKVPKTTTLIELLSFAQGPDNNAKLSKVRIKRTAEKVEKTFTVDVEELIDNPNAHDIPLMANDIVYVEPRKPFLDPQVVTTVSVLATVATLISTVFIIRDRSK